MSSIAIENIDGTLLEQIKRLAIQAGASFRIFPDELPLTKEMPTLPPLKQAIPDMPSDKNNEDIMTYAGIFRGAWGETPEQVETSIAELKAEWEN